MNENFCKTLSEAIGLKKVVIYGAGYIGASMLNIMDTLGKEVLFFLDQNLEKQKNGFYGYEVKAPEDILYEDMSKIIVVIAVGVKEEVEGILIGLGLREGVEFIHGGTLRYELCNIIDPFLGYNHTADINGFKIMGNYDKKRGNIICLGGSTTDYSFYGIKSWTEFLFELLEKDSIHLNVLNGGVVGHKSSQELLKLIRDGLELEPSLVISYSGINDLIDNVPTIGNEYLYEIWGKMETTIIESRSHISCLANSMSLSYGAKTKLDAAEYWYRNEIMMCNICRGFNIPFLGILQPTVLTKKSKMRSLYEERTVQIYSFKKYAEKQFIKAKQLVNAGVERNIVDFTALFDLYDNVYVDTCHVFEQGNKIIAEAIYETIKEKKLLDL